MISSWHTMLALLPPDWFIGQGQLLLLVIAAAALVAVIKGADWLVEGAAGIASSLGMPKVVIGATIVSLGTTSPEAAVSVLAAWQGQPGLALGNGVGSVIADTGLIFGCGCLLVNLPANRYVLSRQGWVQVGAAVMLALICYTLFAGRGDEAFLGRCVGLLFTSLLILYMYMSVRWSRQHPHGEPFIITGENHQPVPALRTGSDVFQQAEPKHNTLFLLTTGVIGLAIVIIAGSALVASVSELAEVHWGVPKVVIAATLVALGTSLPELAVGLTSIYKGHPELLVGNVIGADILNVLFVIGASALAAPLTVVEDGNHIFLYLHLPTMLLILLLFRLYIFRAVRRGQFSRWMGLPMVLIYTGYVILQYVLST